LLRATVINRSEGGGGGSVGERRERVCVGVRLRKRALETERTMKMLPMMMLMLEARDGDSILDHAPRCIFFATVASRGELGESVAGGKREREGERERDWAGWALVRLLVVRLT
jgi:hypothetical protein